MVERELVAAVFDAASEKKVVDWRRRWRRPRCPRLPGGKAREQEEREVKEFFLQTTTTSVALEAEEEERGRRRRRVIFFFG